MPKRVTRNDKFVGVAPREALPICMQNCHSRESGNPYSSGQQSRRVFLRRTGLSIPCYLKEFAMQFGYAVHAFVLMTNHVRLLLTPHRSEGPVSMRLLERSSING